MEKIISNLKMSYLIIGISIISSLQLMAQDCSKQKGDRKIKQCWFEKAQNGEKDLRNAKLGGNDFTNGVFDDADLSSADLLDANLTNASLKNTNLQGANLNGVHLNNANLTKANLHGAEMGNADLSNANMNDANLENVKFNWCKLAGTDLTGANIKGAHISAMRNTEIDIADWEKKGGVVDDKARAEMMKKKAK